MSDQFSVLALDIGSNSVGSMWLAGDSGKITVGTSVFPAGVDESDDKRGEPKNAKRRMTRRTRITLARRSQRKRELKLALVEAGLLPATEAEFIHLLETTDPWALRCKGLNAALSPHELGRVLLHLAQRRGALGLKIVVDDEADGGTPGEPDEDGKVKAAIGEVRQRMLVAKARTFGEFMWMQRESTERVHPLTGPDQRPEDRRIGKREYRDAIRNKAGSYEHCADRAMIRHEFAELWKAQKKLAGGGGVRAAKLLTDALRLELDNESGDSVWRHRGLLFGQRRQTWDLGSLGRCVLEPTERCAPHADRHASGYLVAESVNNIRIIERGKPARALTPEERSRIVGYLGGPLGTLPELHRKDKKTGKVRTIPERPKQTVSVDDLRGRMAEWYGKEHWPGGVKKKLSPHRFNIEADEDRVINTDWFHREVVHGAITLARWEAMPENVREGVNRALLSHDPEQDGQAEALRAGVLAWAGLSGPQADALVAAWRARPKLDAKRLNMSRRAVRNLLAVMDRPEPWPDARTGEPRWLTQIEARKLIAEDADFRDLTTGKPLDEHARRRYATGAKGLSARDRHYLRKHPDDLPPAPMLSNPVVRKAIHEVRRHILDYLRTFGRKPDEIYIELAREAKMGAKQSDRLLFRIRLRNRIRRDIAEHFDLDKSTPTQRRAAEDRVLLAVQQAQACPMCGKKGLTPRKAALGEDCEVCHILPRASGGENGLSNIVLGHTKCNRDMGRRTPRQYWSTTLKGGFDEGMQFVEGIFGDVKRPKLGEARTAADEPLWSLFFDFRDDQRKIEQFAKDIGDTKDMTARQEAATKYAARQVMAYLADALFDGKGLPERGGERRIFATDGPWTGRFRREWGLFFDPHDAKGKGLSTPEEHARKEKNRGDHRHHAIDAVVIGLCTRSVQMRWENREKAAEAAGVNTADEEQMDAYRRKHPVPPPSPFKDRDELREAVRRAVFGDGQDVAGKPVCHRPVKRKLIGAMHEETLFGPVLDARGGPTGQYTAKKPAAALTSNHLRMPDGWDDLEAQLQARGVTALRAAQIKRDLAAMDDPPAGKSGIVRDRALRNQLRRALRAAGIDPDNFTANQIKKAAETRAIRHDSGVPIRSVVLLRTMSDPVVIDRKRPDYTSGGMVADEDPASRRAYLGGNNHHIEIRSSKNKKGVEVFSGVIVSAFEAAQRKLARLRALREAKIPPPRTFRGLERGERKRLTPILRQVEQSHPLVDRTDDPAKGGAFVMSLCEGEMLLMKHKETREVGYFVVAKLDKPQAVVLVPHWDARAAGERKDSSGNPVPDSKREQFSATPSDLLSLAPPDHPHAVKVQVSPLGAVTILEQD